MANKQSGFQFWGIVLIAVGVILLLGQFNLLQEEYFMYYLSGGFFLVYFLLGGSARYGNIGFLIPACMLLVISVFAGLEEMDFFSEITEGMLFFFFLALAFIGVYLHTVRFTGEDWGTRNWPLFPAGGLVLFGSFVLFVENVHIQIYWENIEVYLAVLLIASGVYFWVKGFIKQRRRKVEENG